MNGAYTLEELKSNFGGDWIDSYMARFDLCFKDGTQINYYPNHCQFDISVFDKRGDFYYYRSPIRDGEFENAPEEEVKRLVKRMLMRQNFA